MRIAFSPNFCTNLRFIISTLQHGACHQSSSLSLQQFSIPSTTASNSSAAPPDCSFIAAYALREYQSPETGRTAYTEAGSYASSHRPQLGLNFSGFARSAPVWSCNTLLYVVKAAYKTSTTS
jgi:hypothetical protein